MYSYFGDGMFRPSILLDREGFGFLGQSLQRADHHPSSSSDDSVVSGFPAMSADAVRFWSRVVVATNPIQILSSCGGFNPFEKYLSKLESSPNRGEN